MKTIKPKITKIDTRIGAGAVKRIVGREHKRIRQRILLRDGYTCQKCGRMDCGTGLEIDHIVPLDSGGRESDSNRWVLCINCHKAKTASEAAIRCGSD